MICSFIMVIAFHFIDSEKSYSVLPVPSAITAENVMRNLQSPEMRARLTSDGIMKVEIHDIKKVKPFKCGN